MNVSNLSKKEIEKRINANDWVEVICYGGYTMKINVMQLGEYEGYIYSRSWDEDKEEYIYNCQCHVDDIEFIIYEEEKNENS